MILFRYSLSILLVLLYTPALFAEETAKPESWCMQISAEAAKSDPNAKVVAANRDFCDYLSRNILRLALEEDPRHPEYGIALPTAALPENLQSGLQERRSNAAASCLSCENGVCHFQEGMEKPILGFCLETFATATKVRRDVIVPNASYYQRVFTVGFGIGKRSRPTKVELLNVEGGRVRKREAKEFMKGALSGFVFEPLIIEGAKHSLLGLYLTIDWN